MSEAVICKKCGATSYNDPGKTMLYCQGCFSAALARAEAAEKRAVETMVPGGPITEETEFVFVNGINFVNTTKHQAVCQRHFERAEAAEAAEAEVARLREALEKIVNLNPSDWCASWTGGEDACDTVNYPAASGGACPSHEAGTIGELTDRQPRADMPLWARILAADRSAFN